MKLKVLVNNNTYIDETGQSKVYMLNKPVQLIVTI